ncbi:MAG: nuclear transport factor 2 family protein [Phreatobacter sp.]|uniref:nuclear transport factor 2 family protein n=1 Tax=Phreatobacter sp. TaxID=1966341 RepID=UPI001A54885C|nr:nuclear transport factor 2 family protein [Phreatobacter sp.]MBL8571575.1 nuclear transport factor 2 family protein [Phreatobacter sp.]
MTDPLPREHLVKVAYAAWARGDEIALQSLVTEDCEFQLVGNPVLNPHSGLRVGKAGLRESVRVFHEDFAVREFLIEKIIAKDDDAVIHWHATLEFVRTGRMIESERCDLIAFEGNLISRMKCFFDSASMAVATGRAVIPDPAADMSRAAPRRKA